MTKLVYKICSRHDIAEILLRLAINTNQSIDQKFKIDKISNNDTIILIYLVTNA